MSHGWATKTWNRSSFVANSIKTLEMVRIYLSVCLSIYLSKSWQIIQGLNVFPLSFTEFSLRDNGGSEVERLVLIITAVTTAVKKSPTTYSH